MSADGLPSRVPRPPDELAALERAWRPPRGWRLLASVNNSHVGLFYIGTALLFFVLAGLLGLLMRAQLALPENTLLDERTYNQVFTMHGTVMMFLFAVPVVEAIAVYLLPPMLGARDLPFPRLSAYAFWAYAAGGLAFFCTLFFGVAPDGGWFMYPPLTSARWSPGLGADFWLLGIGFIEISAIAGAVELIIGILFTRAPGMTLARMPVFAWAMLVVAFMIVFAFPAVIAGTALLELERAFDWPFFIAQRGGDPLLWQHLFWFFGHPEVYIIFLPAAGLVSMLVPVVAGTPLAGRRAVVAALVAVGLLSFALWLHHMFTAGLGPWSTLLVSAASLAIAIPTGVQVFAWIATLARGRVRWSAAAWFLMGFFAIFVLGGLTGVMVAVVPFDAQVHDTYFVVAHFHYVLVGGLVFPMFAALYHWFPLLNGHRLSERAGRWACVLMFAGFNLAFFPMHVTGLLGMPRRVATYAADAGWSGLNLLSSAGAAVLAAGVAVVGLDVLLRLRGARQPHGNPWGAGTLEWIPNGSYGLRSVPQVRSAEPLWDQPELEQQVQEGAHWLPGTVTGGRETLVTSPGAAQLRHLLVLTGDSWLPLVAALGTAGFFLLLTVKLTLSAWACGAVAVGTMLRWAWHTDRPPQRFAAPVGDGVHVPVGAGGRGAHAWWATGVLLAVDASIFASLLFAHVHVSLAADVCPPPGASLARPAWPLAAALLWLGGSAALVAAQRSLKRGRPPWRLRALLALAVAAALAAGACEGLGYLQAGLDPRAQAWSATVATLLAVQGLHALLLGVLGAYVWARSRCGLLHLSASALDVTALVWHYTTVQALVLEAVVNGLPAWLA